MAVHAGVAKSGLSVGVGWPRSNYLSEAKVQTKSMFLEIPIVQFSTMRQKEPLLQYL